jgi:hypothetical protein
MLRTSGRFPFRRRIVLKKLSRGARACLKVLKSYLGGKDHCWPSQLTIARQMQCSRRSVIRYIQELSKCQIVTSTRDNRNSTNTYHLQADLALQVSPRKRRFVTSRRSGPYMNLKSELGNTPEKQRPSETLNPEDARELEVFIQAHEARFPVAWGGEPIPRKPATSQGAPVRENRAVNSGPVR